jgi:hypothetical protein
MNNLNSSLSVVPTLNLVFKSKPNIQRRHSQKLSAHFQHSVRIYVTRIESLTYKLSRFSILWWSHEHRFDHRLYMVRRSKWSQRSQTYRDQLAEGRDVVSRCYLAHPLLSCLALRSRRDIGCTYSWLRDLNWDSGLGGLEIEVRRSKVIRMQMETWERGAFYPPQMGWRRGQSCCEISHLGHLKRRGCEASQNHFFSTGSNVLLHPIYD